VKKKKFFPNLGLYFVTALLLITCKDPFYPPVNSSKKQYLVVEGYLNAAAPTVIKLSYTRSISPQDTARRLAELKARVTIEDDHENSYRLNETGNGTYTINADFFNTASKYRVRIITVSGNQYLSDFVPFKPSPPISNIDWNLKYKGVQLYVNTQDAQNNTRYYRWEYEETWEFHTQLISQLKFNEADSSVTPRTEQVHICWNSHKNTNIILGSSAKLKEDIIYHYPLIYFPEHDERLSVLYSIIVTQFPLDSSAYNYWMAMKSNTENVGSVFDPQPNETKGNIHLVSDSTETVIGYISAGSSQQLRVFIANSSLPSSWNIRLNCPEIFVSSADAISLFLTGYTPLYGLVKDGVRGFNISLSECADCTIRGVNIKPAFWP
jgi:hypothetical protein